MNRHRTTTYRRADAVSDTAMLGDARAPRGQEPHAARGFLGVMTLLNWLRFCFWFVVLVVGSVFEMIRWKFIERL